MKIKILGAGETGKFLAQQLSQKQHKITLIDESETLLAELSEVLEVATVCGNGAEAAALNEANTGDAELFLALTNNAHVNLIAASLAKSLGAKKAIAKVTVPIQQSQQTFDYSKHFQIDYLFSSEQLTAAELGKYFTSPEATGIEQIGRGRIKVQWVDVDPRCTLLGQPIHQLTLPNRVRICVIHRKEETIIAKGNHSLQADDQVTLFGEQIQVEKLAKILQAEKPQNETKRITIYGGNDYGFCMANQLSEKRYKVRLIEKDAERCAFLSKHLPHTAVIHGDGRSLNLLKEEQVSGSDFYIGATLNDEDNIMACLQADSLSVKHVIPIVHDADKLRIMSRNLSQFGFRTTVSPKLVNQTDILRFVDSKELHHVGFLSHDVELVQFTVREGANVAGKQVRDVDWPKACSLITFLRNEEVIVPDGHDQILPGDALYAVILEEAGKPLRNLLTR